jgi:cell division protein FtsB
MSSTAPQRRTRLAPHRTGAAPGSSAGSPGRARLAVVPRLRSRAPRVPFIVLVSALLLTGVVGLLLFNTSMQQASFTAAQLEDQADVLAARNQALRTELETRSSPERIALIAQCRLGMVVGPQAGFLDVHDGRVQGVPQAAAADPAARAEACRGQAGARP